MHLCFVGIHHPYLRDDLAIIDCRLVADQRRGQGVGEGKRIGGKPGQFLKGQPKMAERVDIDKNRYSDDCS